MYEEEPQRIHNTGVEVAGVLVKCRNECNGTPQNRCCCLWNHWNFFLAFNSPAHHDAGQTFARNFAPTPTVVDTIDVIADG